MSTVAEADHRCGPPCVTSATRYALLSLSGSAPDAPQVIPVLRQLLTSRQQAPATSPIMAQRKWSETTYLRADLMPLLTTFSRGESTAQQKSGQPR